MTSHQNHQVRLSGNRTVNKKNPLTIMVRGFFLPYFYEKSGIKNFWFFIIKEYTSISLC